MNTDKLIRVSTAATAIGIAGVAAVVSYRHAFDVVTDHGEPRATAALVPLCVDGLVYAAGMVHLNSARRGEKAGALAWLSLGLGIGATIAVNVLHGIEAGPVGAVVAAWPAVTLVLVVELLMGMIRRGRRVASEGGDGDTGPGETATQDATPGAAVARDMRHGAGPLRGDMAGIVRGDTAGDIEGPRPAPVSRRRTATKATKTAAKTATQGDADRATEARALLAEEPDMSGAELGRRLGLSARQGQRLLSDIRATVPTPGQMTLEDDGHDTQSDTGPREARIPVEDDDTTETTDDRPGDAPRLSVVGGDR